MGRHVAQLISHFLCRDDIFPNTKVTMSYDANNAYPAGPGAAGPGAMGPGAGGFGGQPRGAASPEDLSLPLYGASFGQAVKRFFKKYTHFSGRASRSEFWWMALFAFLVQLIPMILITVGAIMAASSAAMVDPYDPAAAQAAMSGPGVIIAGIGYVIGGLIALAMIIPNLAITWRRLHDANFAGPFFFLSFIPGVGGLIVFVLELLPSKPEGQRFDV